MSNPLQQFAKRVQKLRTEEKKLDAILHSASTPEERRKQFAIVAAHQREIDSQILKITTQTTMEWENHLAQ